MIRENVEKQSVGIFGRESNSVRPQLTILRPVKPDPFLSAILSQMQKLYLNNSMSFQHNIKDTGWTFLLESRSDLERWFELLSSRSISEEEFHWLIQARVHLAEFTCLRDAALSSTEIDDFRISLVRSITETTFRLIGH